MRITIWIAVSARIYSQENDIIDASCRQSDIVGIGIGAVSMLHLHPTDLKKLTAAIDTFIKDIPGKKFMLLDALSTLLIYNDENKVAQFVKEITEYAAEKDVEVFALSPKTKGEELLNKIFNFFDKVKKK